MRELARIIMDTYQSQDNKTTVEYERIKTLLPIIPIRIQHVVDEQKKDEPADANPEKSVIELYTKTLNQLAPTSGDLGWNLAHYAARYNTPEIITVLCRYLATANEEVLNSLLNDCDKNGMTPLQIAATHGSEDVIVKIIETVPQIILKFAPTSGDLGWNLAHYAARYNIPEIITVLCRYLATANEEVLNSLLNDCDKNGMTPLQIAITHGSEDVIVKIIKNAPHFKGRNIAHNILQLMINIEKSNKYNVIEMLEEIESCLDLVLTKYRENLNLPDDDGVTLAHLAARIHYVPKNKDSILERIMNTYRKIHKGYTIDNPYMDEDNKEENLLHYAIKEENEDAIETILRHVKENHIEFKDKSTPLHIAAKIDSAYICQLLIDKGYSITEKDASGNTPYYYAKSHDTKQVLGTYLSETCKKRKKTMEEKKNMKQQTLTELFKNTENTPPPSPSPAKRMKITSKRRRLKTPTEPGKKNTRQPLSPTQGQ